MYVSPRVKILGAGAPVRSSQCLLYVKPEECRPVFWSEFKADAAIDHRYGIRVQGEGCEGIQVCGLKEVELHLHVSGVVQANGVVR